MSELPIDPSPVPAEGPGGVTGRTGGADGSDGADGADGSDESTARRTPWAVALARPLVLAVIGVFVGAIGTAVHRYDVEVVGLRVPVGVVLALLTVVSASLLARAWAAWAGLSAFALGWFVMVFTLAQTGPGGDVLVPENGAVGYVWLLAGAVGVVVGALAPPRWFARPR